MNFEKRHRSPRRGDVLFEHYDVLDCLESDVLVATYRTRDRRDRSLCLVRHIMPGLLSEEDARRMVDRLRPMVGVGGAALSALKSVGHDGSTVFSVEDWPQGVSLARLFDARSAEGRSLLDPNEALLILTRLASALAAIPEGAWHGDLRAERVWVHHQRVTLTGGFLVAALPGDTMSRALMSASAACSKSFAPEVREGLGGRASDRWGVASILGAGLFSAGDVRAELACLLEADPSSRPPTLDALAAALAVAAGLPVPALPRTPEIVSLDANSDDETQVIGMSRSSDTLEIPLELVDETAPQRLPSLLDSPAGDSNTHHLNSAEFELLDSELDREVARSQDLDPDLVRAALGISTPTTGRPAPTSAWPAMPPLPASPAPPASVAPPRPPAVPRSRSSRPKRPAEPVPLPADIKPIPRPHAGGDTTSGEMSGPVLFDASNAVWSASAPTANPESSTKKARMAAEPTMIVRAASRSSSVASPAPRPRRTAWILVLVAVLSGILIVLFGVWYRRAQERDAERYQRIEQRLRELQAE